MGKKKNKVINYKDYKKNKNKKMNQQLKKKKKLSLHYAGLGFAVAVGIVLLCYLYLEYVNSSTIKYIPAKKGSLTISEQVSGLLLRDEVVYFSPSSGSIQIVKKEGDKTALNRTLLNIAEDSTNQTDGFMRSSVMPNVIISQNTGTVSYLLDGLEQELEGGYEELGFQKYKNIVDKTLNTYITATTAVNKGDAACKIISSPKWRVVTYLPLEEEYSYEEGKEYQLTFLLPEKASIDFNLISKTFEDKNMKLVFETQEQQQKFLNYRSLSFYIGEMEKTGIKLPKTTLVERNLLSIPVSAVGREQDINVVSIIRNNNERVVPIEIVTSSLESIPDHYFVLLDITTENALRHGDRIITEEGQYTVKDILIEKGVYVINGRVAQFKPINIIAEDEESILIQEWMKDSVMDKDWVILDSKSISNNQLFTKEKIKEYH